MRHAALALVLLQWPGHFLGPFTVEPAMARGTILALQASRLSETVDWPDPSRRQLTLTLTNLHPKVNAEFLLTLQWSDGRKTLSYHIENPSPATQRLALGVAQPGQLSIVAAEQTTPCTLWPGDALHESSHSQLAFAPLCGGRLYLRNAIAGNRTALEATTEFLRDHVWRGEQIIGFVRRELYQDAFIERATAPALPVAGPSPAPTAKGPAPARTVATGVKSAVAVTGLGINIGGSGPLLQGRWYAADGLNGVYMSVAEPAAMADASTSATGRGRALDPVESRALVYMVAFDLSTFELGFALGTEHPRLTWSARAPQSLRDAGLPGPDGFSNAAPLVRTGMVNPKLQPRVFATFTGGFKREHGAFRYGVLANVNSASHYGFVEQGVVYSRLVPGLSTLYVLGDGSLGMKTWSREDDLALQPIRHARQNGVPLIERDPSGGASSWGSLVDAWGAGNWSGSADEKLRTLRAGACLADHGGRSFLIYGYFSTATPRAMARVFQSYGCTYAMHLDMNALEHTYLAVYRRTGEHIEVEHLITGMAALDKAAGANVLPRFLGFSDDRDFFYLMARQGQP